MFDVYKSLRLLLVNLGDSIFEIFNLLLQILVLHIMNLDYILLQLLKISHKAINLFALLLCSPSYSLLLVLDLLNLLRVSLVDRLNKTVEFWSKFVFKEQTKLFPHKLFDLLSTKCRLVTRTPATLAPIGTHVLLDLGYRRLYFILDLRGSVLHGVKRATLVRANHFHRFLQLHHLLPECANLVLQLSSCLLPEAPLLLLVGFQAAVQVRVFQGKLSDIVFVYCRQHGIVCLLEVFFIAGRRQNDFGDLPLYLLRVTHSISIFLIGIVSVRRSFANEF